MGNIVLENKQKKFLNWVYSTIMLNESMSHWKDLLTRILKNGEYEENDKKILNQIREQYLSQYDELNNRDVIQKIRDIELFNIKLTYLNKLFDEFVFDKSAKEAIIDKIEPMKTEKEIIEYYKERVEALR